MKKVCIKCGKLREHHGHGLCYSCYKKYSWKPKKIVCKRCGRTLPMHAKDLCPGCYQFVFRTEPNKAWNWQKRHGVTPEQYKQITNKCVICGFTDIVDLHHIDGNSKNNSKTNLIGVCPNHHRMIHEYKYRQKMLDFLKDKGFEVPKDLKLEFSQN